MRDADYTSNDVPAAIPAAGQVKWNVNVDETILTDEAVEMVRTSVLRLVGVNSGRSAEERQHNPCPLEIGSDDDATAALSENEEPASEDTASRELDGMGTMGEATPRSECFGGGGGSSSSSSSGEGGGGRGRGNGDGGGSGGGGSGGGGGYGGGVGGVGGNASEDGRMGTERDAVGGNGDYGKSGTSDPDGLDLDLGGRETCGDGSDGDGGKDGRMGQMADFVAVSKDEGNVDDAGDAAALAAAIGPGPGRHPP
jgi:hypothetical protein